MAPVKRASYKFELFRYQLLPATRNLQQDMYQEFRTIDELKKVKNKIFDDVLTNFPSLRHRGMSIKQRVDFHKGDWFIMHIGAQKSIERDKEDFRKEWIESWPNVVVIINNNPDTQIIAVSKNIKAFSSSSAVVSMIANSLHRPLWNRQIQLEVEAIFEKQDFWELIDSHQGKVTSVNFQLVSPNIANISKHLTLDLAQINADTNSHRTDLQLNSAKDSVLEIQKDNSTIDGLVEYASKGGGDIHIRVKGLKSTIKTSSKSKSFEVDELTIHNPNEHSLSMLKALLDD